MLSSLDVDKAADLLLEQCRAQAIAADITPPPSGDAGIIFRVLFGNRYRSVAVTSYVLLGWLCVIAAKPILTTVPTGALLWIVAGGLAYTSGVVFFASKRVPHGHAIWHLFVLGGSICHFFAVVLYVLPAKA